MPVTVSRGHYENGDLRPGAFSEQSGLFCRSLILPMAIETYFLQTVKPYFPNALLRIQQAPENYDVNTMKRIYKTKLE